MKDTYFFSTDNMSVGYNKIPLIKDISIGIHKGEILTLIGPNGSGKSTILKNIIRELTTITGVITIDGKEIQKYSNKEYAKKLAVVLTEKIKTDMMTCRDVVAMGRYPYTNYFGHLTKEDNKIVDEALKQVHAEEIQNQDFTCISDGQRQRIMLARAICQKPEVIVLDEPTSFLDIKHKIELLGILREMANENKVTVIMSLHEIDLASKISDYVLCVKKDRSIDFGTPAEIFTNEKMRALYELESGEINVEFGSVELKKAEGNPQVFVIGGGGYGVPVYRELQRKNIPFSAGIIFENDVDYPVAHALAVEIAVEKPFSYIGDYSFKKSCNMIDLVDYVIDAGCPIGMQNERLIDLFKYARKKGKMIQERGEEREWNESEEKCI